MTNKEIEEVLSRKESDITADKLIELGFNSEKIKESFSLTKYTLNLKLGYIHLFNSFNKEGSHIVDSIDIMLIKNDDCNYYEIFGTNMDLKIISNMSELIPYIASQIVELNTKSLQIKN